MKLSWKQTARDNFAHTWPCCDVPATGWAEFESNGDLVDISDNTQNCEPSGGLSEFLSDMQSSFEYK